MPSYDACVAAPFAVLGLSTEGNALAALHYLPAGAMPLAPRNRTAARVVREIERYLADFEYRFTVPLAPRGTAFQRRCWDAIAAIPLGESRTYGEVARSVRSAARAVGQACGANPIALVIPCHRVVGSRGALGGFMRAAGPSQGAHRAPSGGVGVVPHAADGEPLAIKRWLLVHEGYRFGQ